MSAVAWYTYPVRALGLGIVLRNAAAAASAAVLFGQPANLAGVAVVVAALRGLSEAFGDRRVFRYGVYALALWALDTLILAAWVYEVAAALREGFPTQSQFAYMVLLYVASPTVFVIVAYFFRRAYELLSERTASLSPGASSKFRAAARLYRAGALLSYLFVGYILILVALILVAAAFDDLRRLAPPARAP